MSRERQSMRRERWKAKVIAHRQDLSLTSVFSGGYGVMSVSTASALELPDLGIAAAKEHTPTPAAVDAGHSVTPKGNPQKGKTAKAKGGSARGSKRNASAASADGTPSKVSM